MVERVCGITDPFCSAANGAKYPDGSPVRTLPYTYHGRYSMSSGVNSAEAFLWHPQFTYDPFTVALTRAGDSVTAWANFPTATAAFAAASSYRIISSGFILRCVLAPLNASGMLHIRSWTNGDMAKYGTLLTRSYTASRCLDIPIQDVKELCVVTQRSARMPQMFNITSDDSNVVIAGLDNGFTPVSVYITGAPVSTQVFDVEYFVNMELVFADEDGIGLLSTPPPPSNTALTAAAAKVTSAVTTVFHRSVRATAEYVATKAAAAIAGYVGGPMAAGAVLSRGLLRDVD